MLRQGFRAWPGHDEGSASVSGVWTIALPTACFHLGTFPTAIISEGSPWFESSPSPHPTSDLDTGPGPHKPPAKEVGEFMTYGECL